MTWDDLQRTRNELKWLATNKKQPNLKERKVSKKRTETAYSKQETNWNNLQQARNKLKRPTMSKKQPETTCKEQILTSCSPFTWKIFSWRAPITQGINRSILCLQYLVSSAQWEMMAGREINPNVRTRQIEV